MAYYYKRIKLPDGTTRDEHRIVMKKYLGRHLLSTEIVHHINGNTRDNNLSNLELSNRRDHAKLHLTGKPGKKMSQETKDKLSKVKHLYGSQLSNAKLVEKQVEQIKYLLNKSDLTDQQIADLFKVARSTVQDIKHKRCWKHVEV